MGISEPFFSIGLWECAGLFLYLCGLPVGMPTLAGTLAGTVVRGATPKRGFGDGLRVGLVSAPLTLVAEFAIAMCAERRIDNATWVGADSRRARHAIRHPRGLSDVAGRRST